MSKVDNIADTLIAKIQRMKQVYKQVEMGRTADEVLLKQKIEVWAANLGGALGHLAEFEIYDKHHFRKGRRIAPSARAGDVVIGQAGDVFGQGGDVFAKTIQSKAVTTDSSPAVTTHLSTAMQQMAGLRHEHPRPNDGYAILITIYNTENYWPFTSKDGRPMLQTLEAAVIGKVKNALDQALGMTASNSTNTLMNIFNAPQETVYTPGPRSSKPHQPGPERVSSRFDPVTGKSFETRIPTYLVTSVLVVKIRWPFGYTYDHNGIPAIIKGLNVRVLSPSRYEISKRM